MDIQKIPPRSWEIDDLLDIGRREGDKAQYLKAIPVLILEEWVRKGRKIGEANFARTAPFARRIENCGLHPKFILKGTSNIIGALKVIQASRNLNNPPLLEKFRKGMEQVNLPYYEHLLQDYRKEYSKLYPEDYKRLFPKGEPEWESPEPQDPAKVTTKKIENKLISAGLGKSVEIRDLLDPIEQAFRDQQKAVLWLTEENKKLREMLFDLQTALRVAGDVPPYKIIDDELRNDCAEFLKKPETYLDSIRRAGVVIEERLRKTIGGEGQGNFKFGVDLVDYALLPVTGQIIISENPAEQDGVHKLFRGAVQFVRNPPSHKKMLYSEIEAVKAIGLIDYLLLLLGQAKSRKP